jgi:hypothetical protein
MKAKQLKLQKNKIRGKEINFVKAVSRIVVPKFEPYISTFGALF